MNNQLNILLSELNTIPIAIYGLSTETDRFLTEYGNRVNVIGLLDGFRNDGELFGYPVMSIESAVEKHISAIIVIARPGSCKAIKNRIGDICRDNGILLYDVRGKDLLAEQVSQYNFSSITGYTKSDLMRAIRSHDVISFDLFDTLVTRKVIHYTDIFYLVEIKLRDKEIIIPDFVNLRTGAEKKLSKDKAPILEEIYEELLRQVGGSLISAKELSELEWEIDRSTIFPRKDMCDVFRQAVSEGKRVVITTDCYYDQEKIESLLEGYGLYGYSDLLVSCHERIFKTQGLFTKIKNGHEGAVLHIGDDDISDVRAAREAGFDNFKIYSPAELMDGVGWLGIYSEIDSDNDGLADRLKAGLFVSHIFNSPFMFENSDRKIKIDNAFELGYLLFAPIICDFVLWLYEKVNGEKYKQVLFCARDGYLIGRLYRMIDSLTKSVYFLTSRTAAIRAGVKAKEDLEYVNSMKFSGDDLEGFRTRFGLSTDSSDRSFLERMALDRAFELRKNYDRYIKGLDLFEDNIALFDFVAKGTSQMFLRNIIRQNLKGFYFLQLEPEFMKDKNLNVEAFYSDEERDSSSIFDNYYILETILTSPYPSVEEFDECGMPVFSKENRNQKDIECFKEIQDGIITWFKDYLQLVPKCKWSINKKLDESLLGLVNKLVINDYRFTSFVVEDPFFGRMTDIKDVLDE